MSLSNLFDQINRTRLRLAYQKVRYQLAQKAGSENTSFAALRTAYYQEFWQRTAAALGAGLTSVGGGYLQIKKNSKRTFVNDYEVALDNHLILKIAGNKHIANRLMAEEGFPVPRFHRYDIDSMASAVGFMQEMGKPVVIKPGGGGGGRGVTMFVQTAEDLKKATYHAAVFGTHFIAEEQVEGASFRLLYLGGRFIDAVRRDPPLVRGNGKDTIARLIKLTNQERLVNKPVSALSPLTITYALLEQLKRLDLTLNSVPAKDETVVVNSVVNQNSASENHIVRDQVSQQIIELGERIVRFLGIELAGLDIIAANLSEPLEKTGGIINEINTTPGLHHHDLVAESDKKINVGKVIIDYIFDKQHS